MVELAQLFQDLDQIVTQQEPLVENIEQKGEEIHDNVVQANTEISGAIDKARSRNRKKWWCLLICSTFTVAGFTVSGEIANAMQLSSLSSLLLLWLWWLSPTTTNKVICLVWSSIQQPPEKSSSPGPRKSDGHIHPGDQKRSLPHTNLPNTSHHTALSPFHVHSDIRALSSSSVLFSLLYCLQAGPLYNNHLGNGCVYGI